MRTCAACDKAFPESSYRADRRTKDGLSRRCSECHKNARNARRKAARVTVRSRRSSRKNDVVPQEPIMAPGGVVDPNPWKYACNVSAPFSVTLTALQGALAVSVDRLACSRSCVDAVLEKCAPPIRSHVHWDTRGSGHRAIRRPVRARVGPAERDGRCEGCGCKIRPTPRSSATDLQTVGASVETSAWV